MPRPVELLRSFFSSLRTLRSPRPLCSSSAARPSPSVIPTGAARFFLSRRLLARRAAQRGLCVPRAAPGWSDRSTITAPRPGAPATECVPGSWVSLLSALCDLCVSLFFVLAVFAGRSGGIAAQFLCLASIFVFRISLFEYRRVPQAQRARGLCVCVLFGGCPGLGFLFSIPSELCVLCVPTSVISVLASLLSFSSPRIFAHSAPLRCLFLSS